MKKVLWTTVAVLAFTATYVTIYQPDQLVDPKFEQLTAQTTANVVPLTTSAETPLTSTAPVNSPESNNNPVIATTPVAPTKTIEQIDAEIKPIEEAENAACVPYSGQLYWQPCAAGQMPVTPPIYTPQPPTGCPYGDAIPADSPKCVAPDTCTANCAGTADKQSALDQYSQGVN